MLSTLALHIEFDCSGASCFSKFSDPSNVELKEIYNEKCIDKAFLIDKARNLYYDQRHHNKDPSNVELKEIYNEKCIDKAFLRDIIIKILVMLNLKKFIMKSA